MATVHPDSSLPQVGLPREGQLQNAGQSAPAKANISSQYIEQQTHYSRRSTPCLEMKRKQAERDWERENDMKGKESKWTGFDVDMVVGLEQIYLRPGS